MGKKPFAAVCVAVLFVALSVFVQTALFVRLRRVEDHLTALATTISRQLESRQRTVAIGGSQVFGDAAAKLAVVVYSDYRCVYCRKWFAETYPEFRRDYVDSGKVQFIFKHLPIADAHPDALELAKVVECAGRQGKFWQGHEWAFSRPAKESGVTRPDPAKALGLDDGALAECLGTDVPDRIRQDGESATSLGIRGTPSFVFGVVSGPGVIRASAIQSGAIPMAHIRTIIGGLLSRADANNAISK
jgi:protein-disulfide isomerase